MLVIRPVRETDLESLHEGCKRIQEFCADLK